MQSSLLVRVVFGLLVLATVGAFFVTQRLKRSTPVVERVFYRHWISPNGDGRRDAVGLRFALPKAERVSAAIVSDGGDLVRTLLDDENRPKGTVRMRWDGRDDDGTVVPDGVYHLRVTLRTEGRAVTARRQLVVDTKPPKARIVAVAPPEIVPGASGAGSSARIRYAGKAHGRPVFQVYRTDLPGAPRLVARFEGRRGRKTARWNGLESNGRRAPDGVYAVAVVIRDRAGNQGSAPPRLPPFRGEAGPGSGVSVRYLTLTAPLEPVQAGDVVRFTAGPRQRRLRWNLARGAPSRPTARGRAKGGEVTFRVPASARTGLYLLRVEAAGRRALAPIAVRGHGAGRVLVVLPAISWQGVNPVDDSNDGFADTLFTSGSAGTDRPFAHGALPEGLDAQELPLLRFLDRRRLPYDVTTDLALARGHGPSITGRPGVLFAGSERWLSDQLDAKLRAYVDSGGRVASFGTDAFRRRVKVEARALTGPSVPEPVNIFGEQVGAIAIEKAPMVVSGDELGLFAHTDGYFGLFSRFEQEQRLVPGARVVAKAGRDAAHPALVAYRLRDGLVIRIGTPEWAAGLGDPEVAAVTERTWQLLSR